MFRSPQTIRLLRSGCGLSVFALGLLVAIVVAVNGKPLAALATSPALGKFMVVVAGWPSRFPLSASRSCSPSARPLRAPWRKTDASRRRSFAVYLVGRTVAVVVVWSIVLLVIVRS
jgi:hypothetical protein